MKKLLFSLFAAVLVLSACSAESATNTNTNSNTNSSSEEQDDHRIIAGTYVIATILDKLNLDAVGVVDSTKELPSRFDGVPSVGFVKTPDVEQVKMLNPTEFLTVSTLEYELKESLEKYKIPTDFLDFTSVNSLMDEVTELGERYNRVDEAKALNDQLTADIEKVQAVADQNEKPKVLILLGIPGSYLVATENSYAGDLVRLAGGVNVTQGEKAEYLPSNTEYLYNSNPDIILRLAHGMPEEVVKMFDEDFKTNDVWKHFDAVKNGRVYDLEEELFGTTAALNAPEALKVLQEIFYNK